MGTKKCVDWGFGYRESVYDVGFGLEPGTESYYLQILKHRVILTLRSWPQNLGSVDQNFGARGIYTQR